MYMGGTNQAISFIEKYKKTKQVVDFYTAEHIQSLDPATSSISIEDLEKFDAENGIQYRSHLLTIYIGDSNKELIEDLSNLYLPFKRLFSLNNDHGSWLHCPDFLIINLITREILCVGLGRKNRSFDFELHRYLSIRTTNDEKNILLQSFDGTKSVDCSDEFFALDHHSISKKIITTVEELGKVFYEYDNLPGNSDVMVTRKKDGLYYLDDFDDEDGLTKNEVKELENKYKNCREFIDDSLNLLKEFFPNIEDWDLNTGDY